MDFLKKNIGWIVSIILILLLINKCESPIGSILNGGSEVIKRDTTTIYIKGSPDTVFTWRDTVVYRDRDFHHYHTDTVYNTDSSDFSVGYMYEKNDSVINATLGVWAKERPDSISFEYSALIPEITRVDTIESIIVEKVRVNQVYFGGNATVYPGFNSISMGADFVSKKGWQAELGVGYNLSNNAPMISLGYKRLISFRKR